MRNKKGQFEKGRVETLLEKEKRKKSLKIAIKNRPNYLGDLKLSYLYNSWRAIKHTKKGKLIGYSKDWESYVKFYNDMSSTYIDGLRLFRVDLTKPFSKENCKWMTQEENHLLNNRLIKIEYNNEVKTLKEWCSIFNLPLNAVKQRYNFAKEKHTSHEILFGRDRKKAYEINDYRIFNNKQVRAKASKMISSYRCSDKKKGFDCDLTIDYLIDKIFKSKCVYCGTKDRIGCDRIDNNKGHIVSNIVPSCYTCNTTRSNRFSHEEMKLLGITISNILKKRRN